MDIMPILSSCRKHINDELGIFFNEIIFKETDPVIRKNKSYLRDYIVNGGKRLRPIALIMAYRSISGDQGDKIMRPSLSVELLHNSSLIFDDIMDEDDIRWGRSGIQKRLKDDFLLARKDAMHDGNIFSHASKRYAASVSMLAGLVADSLSKKVLIGAGFPGQGALESIDMLNNCMITLCEGQVLDIDFEMRDSVSEEEYILMNLKKTGALFAASLGIGATLAGASRSQLGSLRSFAENAAIAFQIRDDLMDIDPSSKKGHALGSDIIKGKKTLLLIKALGAASDAQKKTLLGFSGESTLSHEDIAICIEIFRKTGAISYCEKLSQSKVTDAKSALTQSGIPSAGIDFFSSLADYMAARKI
jgi:geranylgeranyl diphosphate synthase, type I